MAKQGEKKTKIFIRDATNIDCALLMPEQAPVGKSWSVDIVWTGYTNNEGIIFDFSLARKAAKKTIDTFFDHKLYVRQKVISRMPGKRSLICEQCRDLNGRYFILDTCNEAIALFEEEVFREIQLSDSPTLLEAIIADAVLKESPENVTEVAVELREHTHKFRGNYFSYTHSLNRHYGNCQRFHGHSNIIEVFSGNQLDYGESEKAAQLLNNKYIINRGHLREIQKSKRLSAISERYPFIRDGTYYTVEYDGSHGAVALAVPRELGLVINSDSTIENLALYIKDALKLGTEKRIYAYEGLKKGAVV